MISQYLPFVNFAPIVGGTNGISPIFLTTVDVTGGIGIDLKNWVKQQDENGKTIGKEYALLDQMAKELGSTLKAPYMTLSFMALLVIPSLKLSDKGLFNVSKFEFTSLEI